MAVSTLPGAVRTLYCRARFLPSTPWMICLRRCLRTALVEQSMSAVDILLVTGQSRYLHVVYSVISSHSGEVDSMTCNVALVRNWDYSL